MENLEGKTAFVTGASQGIGRACALALAKMGARVALAARNEANLVSPARAKRVAMARPRPAEAPVAYLRQLALYRSVLGKLYPQLPVRAALLWTETPELMEISALALDAQLATIIQGDEQA